MSTGTPKPPATIILTGGSRGIGLACLKRLLSSPIHANVVSLSRSYPPELQELKNTHHRNLVVIQGDVSNDSDNKLAVDSALKSFGRIDGLILNSGTIKFERIAESESESEEVGKEEQDGLQTAATTKTSSIGSWKEVFDVNFFSLVSILKHSLKFLRSSEGRVVFVSSGASVGGIASWGSYNASKAAMNSLCRTLASEEPTITSIALRPGVVDTEMQADLRSTAKGIMISPNYKRFYDLYESEKLVNPGAPAEVITNLSLRAEQKLSGEFLSWDSEDLASYRSLQS